MSGFFYMYTHQLNSADTSCHSPSQVFYFRRVSEVQLLILLLFLQSNCGPGIGHFKCLVRTEYWFLFDYIYIYKYMYKYLSMQTLQVIMSLSVMYKYNTYGT